jgi:hypothetical protein
MPSTNHSNTAPEIVPSALRRHPDRARRRGFPSRRRAALVVPVSESTNPQEHAAPRAELANDDLAVTSRATMAALLLLPAVAVTTAAAAPETGSRESGARLPVPEIELPSASGGALAGQGSSTRIEGAVAGVSAERFGVTTDFPEWLREQLGRPKGQPSGDEEDVHRRRLVFAPYVTASPLVGVGFGLAAAATQQLGDPATTRLSKFSASLLLTTEGQVSVPVRSDVVLPGGEWNLVGLWTWKKFPVPTWGLGGNTPDSAETTVDYDLLRFYEIVNRRIARNFYLGAGYRLDYYYDVVDEGAAAGQQTAFSTYPHGTGSTSLSSSLALNALYDSRDSPIFAMRGVYGNLSYAFTPRALGSDTSWQSAYLDLRGYRRLSRRLALGLWSYGWFSFGDVPYFGLPAIGSDPDARSGRGYIEGRHRGKALLYGEGELRLRVWQWLGAVLALNVHSASEPGARGVLEDEPRFRYWWPSVVIGARVLAVKQTHSNLCIDVAFGRDGQNGVYFNFAEAF